MSDYVKIQLPYKRYRQLINQGFTSGQAEDIIRREFYVEWTKDNRKDSASKELAETEPHDAV